jgi:hypothetical protein
MTAPERLIIKAFVCGGSCVVWINHEGSTDLINLVKLCPTHCRYAIVSWYGHWYVLDVKGDANQEVKPMKEYPDVDTAIMAAQLTY